MTMMVFTFVLLLGNALKEILPLLVSGQVSFGTVAEAVGLLVPFVWVYALPMGMLTATLLIFGRFSADQELTAVRASGISLLTVVSPILLLSVALCVASALVNLELGPRCRVAYTTLLYKLRTQFTTAQLPEGQFIRDFKDAICYVGKNRAGELQDVTIVMLKNETNFERTIRAPRAKLEFTVTNLTLYLTNAKVINLSENIDAGTFEVLPLEFDLEPAKQGPQKPRIDDMTFTQLRGELEELERIRLLPPPRGLTPDQLRARKQEWERTRHDLFSQILFQMHRQVSFSFACFGFTLVGIPLGIRVHRRETNVGIAMALLLVAIYYSFVLLGQALDTRADFAPCLVLWLPNFLFQAVGSVLLWRANRGAG